MCTEREIVREAMSAPPSEMDVAMAMDVHPAATVFEKIPENSQPLGWSRSTSRIPSKSAPRSSTPELKPGVEKRIPPAGPRERPINIYAAQGKPMVGELASHADEPLSTPSARPSKNLHASSDAGKVPAVPSTHERASPASGASAVKSHAISSSVPGQFAKFSSLMSQLVRSSSQPASSASKALIGSNNRSPVPPLSSSSSRIRLSQVPLSSPSDAKSRPSTSTKISVEISSLPSSSVLRPLSPSKTDVKSANSFPVGSSPTVNKAVRSPSPSRIGSQSPRSAPSVARPSSPSISRPNLQSSVAVARPSTPTRVSAPPAVTPKARTSTPTRRTDATRSSNSATPCAKSASSPPSNPAARLTPIPSSTSSSSLTSDNVGTRSSSPARPSAKSAAQRSPSVNAATQPAAPLRSSLKSSTSSSSSSLTAVTASTCRPASPSRPVGKSSDSSSSLTPATITARPASPSRVTKHVVSSSSSASPVIIASRPPSPSQPVQKPSPSSFAAANVIARPASPSRIAKFSGSNSSSLPPINVANRAASPSRPVAKSLGVCSSSLTDRSSAGMASPSVTIVGYPSIPTRSLTKAVKSSLPGPVKVSAGSSIPARHSRSSSCSSLNFANLRAVSSAATQNHARSSPSESPKSAASSKDGNFDTSSRSGNVVAVKKSVLEFQAQQLRISGLKHNPASPKSCARIVPEGLPVSPLTLNSKKRCGWITSQSDGAMVAYHDEEWGTPIYDDKILFELMVLEGAQAELTWSSILALRDDFRVAFAGFDPAVVAKFDEKKIAILMGDPRIPLPEARIRGAIDNAIRVLEIAEEYGSLSTFLWGFVNYKPVVSHYKLSKQVPVKTPKSEVLSNELVRRGLRFVGPTTMYALMQAAGLVNDHLVTCFRREECESMHNTSPPRGLYKMIQHEKERSNEADDNLWSLASDFDSKTQPAFENGHWLNLPSTDTNSRQRSSLYEPVWVELPMIEEVIEEEIERQA